MVAVVRRRLRTRAVGHAGTLDPFATGLLVVLIGRATRLARFVESEAKTYRAGVVFGSATDTDDRTGAVIAEARPEAWPGREVVAAAMAAMEGTHLQVPPAYSAKHVGGARSHALARAGRAVALPAVPVAIHRLALLAWEPPRLVLEATVGKGTYLRAVARDLGERLGIPAHCAELRRTAIGAFAVADAIAPDAVGPEALRPAVAMVPHLAVERLDAAAVREVGFGRRVPRTGAGAGPGALVAAEDGRLVAIGEPTAEGEWQPVVVLEPAA